MQEIGRIAFGCQVDLGRESLNKCAPDQVVKMLFCHACKQI